MVEQEWTGVESTDDPVDFVIPAADTKGHSVRQYFRCMPGYAQQTEEIIQSRRFPYKTKADLFRHALRRHLHWLQQFLPEGVPSVLAQTDLIARTEARKKIDQDAVHALATINESISRMLADGNEGGAIRSYLEYKQYVSDMPDSFERGKMLEELERRWSYLMPTAPKARLIPKIGDAG